MNPDRIKKTATKEIKLQLLPRNTDAHLFVPLLMKVTQKDVGFFCYNNYRVNTPRILHTNCE